MIPNLFLRSASAGNEVIRAFGARLILAMGYGLRQVPAEERKTILEKGLRELWFLSMLVVQWWADKLPGAEAEIGEADGGQRFQRQVAPLDGPLVGLLEQQGSDETIDRPLVREDADDLSAALDLAVQAFERVGGMELHPVLAREVHVGENIVLRFIQEGRELR